uniref:ArnT family glycosyltransferase n=1 Tax=Thaumasiovibrio occultus TaxID=1891184 RepID=UPI000B34F188|nr:glycosyltransferase family 39 protein [Thaumasiovibrio occultus]
MNFQRFSLWWVIALALVLRLASLGLYPLMDTTEARYGEMARLMVETGNWLTPQFDYGVSFWGKPPLFTWMSAGSIQLFGLSEFAVRVPHFAAAIGVLALMGWFARKHGRSALITILVLATCAVFSISAGAVMTDMALTLAFTLAMVGFYQGWLGSRRWSYVGFIGLALGLLAKGPVVLVFMGLAVMPWLMLQHGVLGAFRELWTRFPLAKGLLLMFAIALPWYVMAEIATPGFLDYFIVGEHFKRFVVSGWEGDLYGSAHDEPRGTIWLFWLISALPWSVVLPLLMWQRRQWEALRSPLFSFLMCWMIAPLLLFTLSGNILPAYVLPGIPALGLMVAMLCSDEDNRWLRGVAFVVPAALMIALVVLNTGKADERSDRMLLTAIDQQKPIYYVDKRPFSGQFYSNGQAKILLPETDLTQAGPDYYLIGKPDSINPTIMTRKLSCVQKLDAPSGRVAYLCRN